MRVKYLAQNALNEQALRKVVIADKEYATKQNGCIAVMDVVRDGLRNREGTSPPWPNLHNYIDIKHMILKAALTDLRSGKVSILYKERSGGKIKKK